MVEYLEKEKDKAEKAAIYHAEQYQRATLKLEIIEEMMAEAKSKEPVETAEHCVVCGAVVPEGRTVCPNCETAVD